ncbi:888_t:CDS:2, partial [Gigaspora margarita]
MVNNLTREQIAEKINLSLAETEDILFCCIEKFTLDRLLVYASRLLFPFEVNIGVEHPVTHAQRPIIKVTITDHYKASHGNIITNELILEILETELNEEVLEPTKHQGR